MDDLSAGEDVASTRQREILALVEARGFVTIEDLARLFDVSAQTIRRDIIRLDERGLLQRFHGGAGLSEQRRRPAYDEKKGVRLAAKERIGLRATRDVPTGAAIFLDVGTTLEAAAHALASRADCRVFTSSLAVAAILGASTGGPEVRVLGGTLRGPDGSLVGAEALEALSRLRLDVALVGCSGFDADGAPLDFDPDKVAVKRLAVERARAAYVLADATKFAREALVRVAPAQAFAGLVTDRAPDAPLAAAWEGRVRIG
ncbi:DeoR/GlpR family DNA-binding transcription regulator [Salinarimonas ramus]|uniref:Glycerol-3-phosphate regulon repressor n=1 Tax=Salinarimonas ramus TaxID=690164 RepID=A0A917QDK7_9HYPH|nr:DeoR/GlpR family DNA-binding transcription regulator [Salinarimonas ramus]GGK45571.1 glycerol-3-phosphate regulon repressor [Salinarimonas ramus]